MFTGIVEELGKISEIRRGSISSSMVIEANTILDDISLGDSVSVDGVCLTVIKIDQNRLSVDVMAETLRMSTLNELKPGSLVNLERAMTLNKRFGGHIVSGHVDGTGTIRKMEKEGNAVLVNIQTGPGVMKYLIYKGSVAVDGISLTIMELKKDNFTVSIIPHTGQETKLLDKKIYDRVNLECDVVGKYVERLLGHQKKEDITLEFLSENGFM